MGRSGPGAADDRRVCAGLAEFLQVCEHDGIDPVTANRAHVAVFVRELTDAAEPPRRERGRDRLGCGLANATMQQRLVPVRLFYDFLIEEGVRESNPVGRGRYTPGAEVGRPAAWLGAADGKLPWIPSEQQWLDVLAVFRGEPVAQPGDAGAGLRRGAAPGGVVLAAHRRSGSGSADAAGAGGDDEDPARAGGAVLGGDRGAVGGVSGAPGDAEPGPWAVVLVRVAPQPAEPLTLWTWSKVVRRIAMAAGVPRFSTHTMRHLCLTDLARMGWELHAIATFAGHRSTDSTMIYIHLSGRDLADKLSSGMAQIHAWRVEMLARLGERETGRR